MSRVAVVGAGMAGLCAARALVRAGCGVEVYEKARGPGGRMATRRREGQAFDHGAQYFTCRSDDFRHQVEDWCARGVAAPWDAPLHRVGGGHSQPVEDGIRRYVGTPRMSALARDLAEGSDVYASERIREVVRQADRLGLRTEEGKRADGFDAVVIATPAPQAVPLLDVHPKLAAVAASVGMLPCQATMVHFAERVDLPFGAAFVEDSPLGWVARNASKPGRPGGECWVLHATPAWSEAHVDDDADAVSERLVDAFAELLPGSLPAIELAMSHRWLYARTSQALDRAVLWDASSGIGVCGDWTHGSRVEDAYVSGVTLARSMLESDRLRGDARGVAS